MLRSDSLNVFFVSTHMNVGCCGDVSEVCLTSHVLVMHEKFTGTKKHWMSSGHISRAVSYTHLTLPTNREV